jgi:hypothetical protein
LGALRCPALMPSDKRLTSGDGNMAHSMVNRRAPWQPRTSSSRP